MKNTESDKTEQITIIIPTYNEVENIAPITDAISSSLEEYRWKIIFVDDDSPDGTFKEILKLSEKTDRVSGIKRKKIRGLSSACVTGILASNSPYIAIMDADMQHDESILPTMLNTIIKQQCNLVIATRYKHGG